MSKNTAVTETIPEPDTHIDQGPPYEWHSFHHDGSTFVARDVPEGTAQLYVVEGATRNIRVLATSNHAIYDGNVVRTYYDHDFRAVDFTHDFAGNLACHPIEAWLDEPAVLLRKLRSGSCDLAEVLEDAE